MIRDRKIEDSGLGSGVWEETLKEVKGQNFGGFMGFWGYLSI